MKWRDVCREYSEKSGLPYEEVVKAYQSYWQVVIEAIEGHDLDKDGHIRLFGLGGFCFKPGRALREKYLSSDAYKAKLKNKKGNNHAEDKESGSDVQ